MRLVNSHNKRGGALGLVLAVTAVAMLAAFVAANVATLNLRMASKVSNGAVAEGLAESVVQEAIANLQKDLSFAGSLEIGGDLGLPEGARGYLTFDDSAGVPYSTNNFLGEDATGWKRTLPDKTVHLVGTGECGGVVRHVEAVLHLPEFPVSVACTGPIRVKNSFIAGFDPEDDRQWEPGTGYGVEDDELGPGHLVTNSGSTDSVVMDEDTVVTGDVQSRGGIALNGARVEGEVRPSWGKEATLPEFVLEDFDPKNSEHVYFEELSSVPISATLVGNVRYKGDFTMTGDLNLDNAFLFVRGDVTLKGQLKGVGALVSTGKVTFRGAVNLAGSDQIAVLSDGGIELVGESVNRNVFRGLLYTRGPFSGRKVTVVGGFIVANGQPTELEDSKVFFNGQSVKLEAKRETQAVIPRFYVPTGSERQGDLGNDEHTGQPIAPWAKGQQGYVPSGQRHVPRTVANVLDIEHPDWSRSDWNQYDPAVISVKWVGGQPVFSYRFWGRGPGGKRDEGYFAEWEPLTEEQVIDLVAGFATNSNAQAHLHGAVPNRQAYEAYLRQVVTHLKQDVYGVEGSNYVLPPNEFVVEGDQLRILLYRKF